MDLRGYTTLDEVGEDSEDEVPKYYQRTPLAQNVVDKCKDIPLVGLQYVLEVRRNHDLTLDSCYYICAVCSKKMNAHTLIAHIKSVPHRLKFCESHCKDIYEKYGSYSLKEWTVNLVKEFTMALTGVEKKMGRHKLAVAFETHMSSVLNSLKQKINEIDCLSSKAKENTEGDDTRGTVSQAMGSRVPVRSSNIPVLEGPPPSGTNAKSKSLPHTVLPQDKSGIPLPPTKPTLGVKPPGIRGNLSKEYDDIESEDAEDDVIILDNKKDEGKFSTNGQGFIKRNYRPGPNIRCRSNSGISSSSPSPVRKKSPSKSPPRSRSKSVSPKRKGLRSSRSRSRSLSPKRKALRSPISIRRMKPSQLSPRRRDRHHHSSDRKRRHSRSPLSPRPSRSRSRSRGPRKRYRTRSRSRSRRRSPPYRRSDGRSRRSPPPRRESAEERAKRIAFLALEDFRVAEMKIKARHKNEQVVYEKTPELHPHYSREWKVYWERRCRELEKEGVDPFHYDFKSEWATYWHCRMKELSEINYNYKRQLLLKKFKMKDPDLEVKDGANLGGSSETSCTWKSNETNIEKISRIDRSPSPWEEEGTATIARNPSPLPGDVVNTGSTDTAEASKPAESPAKFEDEFSVIGTLKLLNELEDQLGSFGPAITTLLGKAVDCSQKGEDTIELFRDPDNLVLVRYAREKLSSQVTAGILGVTALLKTQMAVERSMWLQSQAEKLSNEGKYLGLDVESIAKATVGKGTVQIAQYIAQHLLQVGKSDASEGDLQNILYAVLAAHTKLLVESSKKTLNDATAVATAESAVSPAADVTPSTTAKEHVLPAEPTEAVKHPLFPSAAITDNKADDGKADKERADDNSTGDDNSSNDDGAPSSGLSMLQAAYEDENAKDMEKLSLEDLRSLLANFNSLSREEKQALTTYLKKLEATDSKKVMKLRAEMQKNAKSATKVSNAKPISSKPEKSGVQPQVIPHSNSSASQQHGPQGSQSLTSVVENCRELNQPLVGDDLQQKKHSLETSNQPNVPPHRGTCIDSSEKMHDLPRTRVSGGTPSLQSHVHHRSVSPSSSNSDMMQERAPSAGHKPDHFDNYQKFPFVKDRFMEGDKPNFDGREHFQQEFHGPNRYYYDKNYDDYGFGEVQSHGSNPMGQNEPRRYDKPMNSGNMHQGWPGGRAGPRDNFFPHPDDGNSNWYDSRSQPPPYEPPQHYEHDRSAFPFRGRPHRGGHPSNMRQPYRDPW